MAPTMAQVVAEGQLEQTATGLSKLYDTLYYRALLPTMRRVRTPPSPERTRMPICCWVRGSP